MPWRVHPRLRNHKEEAGRKASPGQREGMERLLLANSQRSIRMLPAVAESAPSCTPEMFVSLWTAVMLWQWMREVFHSQTLSCASCTYCTSDASGSMVTLLLLLLPYKELLAETCSGCGAPAFIEQTSSVIEGK